MTFFPSFLGCKSSLDVVASFGRKRVCLEAFGAGFGAFSGSKYSNSAVRPQGVSGIPSQGLEKF